MVKQRICYFWTNRIGWNKFNERVRGKEEIWTWPVFKAEGEVPQVRVKSPEGVWKLESGTSISQCSRPNKARRGTHAENVDISISISSWVSQVLVSTYNNIYVQVGLQKAVQI